MQRRTDKHASSSVRVFSSRPDQTHLCQKLGSVLETLRYTKLSFSYIQYFNEKMHQLKSSETYNMIYFMLGTNSYLFRHQGDIFTDFIKYKGP